MRQQALARPSGQWTADVASFVGRRQELRESKRLLLSTRLLTFTGVGGVGKTRLALRLGGEVRRSYPHGVKLVELALLEDPALLVPTVADALGMSDRSAAASLDGLIDYLADKRMLLVLDNCEHIVNECAVLVHSLLGAAPHLQVLATSRQALRVEGEHILPVSPLSVPSDEGALPADAMMRFDAVKLFVQRAAAVSPGFTITADNRATVARLCQRLEGVPLAIELAAVRTRALSLDLILARLDDVFRFSAGRGRTALPRHQTLRATIDWTYDLCSPHERRMWSRLSVFSGGFDLDAAEEVCSADPIAREDVFAAVAGLVDKSVLVREEHESKTRYRLSDSLQQYGRVMLRDSAEEGTLRRRHLHWCRLLAAQAEADWLSPQALASHRKMRNEHANLRVALDFCLNEPGEAHVAFDIASVWTYWAMSGHWGEGRHWLDSALVRERRPSVARAKALWVNTWITLRLGDLSGGMKRLEEFQSLARALGDASALARSTGLRGMAMLMRGDRANAVALLRKALTQHYASGDMNGTWVALHNLALSESLLGDPDRAACWGEKFVALCDSHGDKTLKPLSLRVVGLVRWRQGDYQAVVTLLREALEINRSFDDHLGLAYNVEALAWATASSGQSERAARLLGAAAMIWRAVGLGMAPPGHMVGAHNGCEAQLRQGLGDEAFGAAFSSGIQLTLDAAIALALGEEAATPVQAAAPLEGSHQVLTRRQREVAALVAEGMSNKDIATRLSIAQRTAEAHVEHILTKLGFSSRAQIGAWATAHL